MLLSPHLDDVAFSCGGIAARLAEAGWRTLIVTAFTRSIHPASGFALECQRDKGLADETDYMALRHEEDRYSCLALGCEQIMLDLPEAPHRGYASASCLFAPPHADDEIARPLADLLYGLLAREQPALVLAPQGCGRHVDHIRMLDAVFDLRDGGSFRSAALGFYRDTPYVIRDPQATPDPRIDTLAPDDIMMPVGGSAWCRKKQAVAAYSSQLGFQFGGVEAALDAIDGLARREAGEQAQPGSVLGERLRTPDRHLLAAVFA